MNDLQQFLGQWIEVEISGDRALGGKLVGVGTDLLILCTEQHFTYIPLLHIQQIKRFTRPPMHAQSEEACEPGEPPFATEGVPLSYRKLLMLAKGRFVEIYVSGFHSLHGYLTSIMNNYFVFYSPVFKTVYLSLDHLKWLIPYPMDVAPYSMAQKDLHVHASPLPLARTFEEQCRKLAGHLVVFDLGEDPEKIGLLVKMEDNRVELVVANGEKRYWNLRHLKTVHVP